MKYDLILVGPMANGKTTFTEVLIKKKAPKEYMSTDSGGVAIPYNRTSSLLTPFSSWKVLDTGGNDREVAQYEKWFTESKKIAFVFDGVKLLEEVKECEKGGKITSFCRKICKMYNENNLKSHLYFIATHKDQYKGVNDFGTDIIDNLREANERYKEITSNHAQRYSFYKQMQGRLFALNAKDIDEVEKTFDKIIDKNS